MSYIKKYIMCGDIGRICMGLVTLILMKPWTAVLSTKRFVGTIDNNNKTM